MRHRPRGFGLLEALVALTLLAGTGTALFAWINQNLAAAARMQEVQAQARLSLAAQSLVADVNPALQPRGERELAALHVRWEAEVLQPLRDNAAFVPGNAGHWQLGLYRLRVEAEDRATGGRASLSLVALGQQRRMSLEAARER